MAKKILNKEQRQAVDHGLGPLLIIAGAGTGKTTVITQRISRLIADGLAHPSEILALTFTEKAAREMEERVDMALPLGYTQMWVMTFHSFCDRILRDEGIHIGLSSDYNLLSATGSVSLMRQHIFDIGLEYFRPLGNPDKYLGSLLTHFDRLRDEDILPDQYSAWVAHKYPQQDTEESVQYHELARCFAYFQELKSREQVLDFGDLIAYTLRLFRERPHILEKYRQKFKYLLVDEYQDTNYAQNQLVTLLAGKQANLTVVADDDQSIYRWRGAAVSNVIQFRIAYPGARLVVLTRNYRSSQAILDAAYALIRHNDPDRLEVREKIDKQLKSEVSRKGEPPQYLHFDRVENEADGIAGKISELLEEQSSLEPGDIAILVRANAHAHPLLSALGRHGIPAQFLGPGKLFDRPEIKDLIAFLRVIKDPTDSPSFFRLISMEYFGIPARDIITLSNQAEKQNLSLYELCSDLGSAEVKISDSAKETVTRIVDLVEKLIPGSVRVSAGQVLFDFLDTSGMLKNILDYRQPLDENSAKNISSFFSKLKGFESENQEADVRSVLEWIDLSREVGESPAATDTDWSRENAVNILTIHSAKGLEFPVVFLVNLVVGRFPSLERKEKLPVPDELVRETLPEGDFHLQEERRLFYVGMTRAKDRLFLTVSDYYGEGRRVKKISPFVSEALGRELVLSAAPAVDQLSLGDWAAPSAGSPDKCGSRIPGLKVSYLSYSQIQTFIDCPLHYKAKYILKIPSPPSAASSFGNTIHKTLREYFSRLSAGQKPDIVKIFTALWTPVGYDSPRHAKEYFSRGEKYLSGFLAENPFTGSPVALEEKFIVPVGRGLKIGGKIDRVDVLPDGSLEIIDYKTSTRLLTEKQAASDLQLSFYALAASLIPAPPFNQSPDKVKLTLYYFDRQQAVSVVQTTGQLSRAREKIVDYASRIENSDFHCSGSIICQKHCDYQVLCDVDKFSG